jgi:hypothetical protein
MINSIFGLRLEAEEELEQPAIVPITSESAAAARILGGTVIKSLRVIFFTTTPPFSRDVLSHSYLLGMDMQFHMIGSFLPISATAPGNP